MGESKSNNRKTLLTSQPHQFSKNKDSTVMEPREEHGVTPGWRLVMGEGRDVEYITGVSSFPSPVTVKVNQTRRLFPLGLGRAQSQACAECACVCLWDWHTQEAESPHLRAHTRQPCENPPQVRPPAACITTRGGSRNSSGLPSWPSRCRWASETPALRQLLTWSILCPFFSWRLIFSPCKYAQDA